jgi:hypothetical protein
MNSDAQMTSVAIQEKTIRLARGLTAGLFNAGGSNSFDQIVPGKHAPSPVIAGVSVSRGAD